MNHTKASLRDNTSMVNTSHLFINTSCLAVNTQPGTYISPGQYRDKTHLRCQFFIHIICFRFTLYFLPYMLLLPPICHICLVMQAHAPSERFPSRWIIFKETPGRYAHIILSVRKYSETFLKIDRHRRSCLPTVDERTLVPSWLTP